MPSRGKNNCWWSFQPAKIPGLRNYFTLVIPRSQQERLSLTCFRGKHFPLAGNFLWWDTARQMMDEIRPMVARLCDAEITRNNHKREQGFLIRITVECGRAIGWQSTTSRLQDEMMRQEDTEKFALNRHTTALRVRSDCDLEAPLTYLVTMVINFHWQSDPGYWKGFIQTIYPGRDIGQLRPNTRRGNFLRGVIFFDWDHPGETDRDDVPDYDLRFILD